MIILYFQVKIWSFAPCERLIDGELKSFKFSYPSFSYFFKVDGSIVLVIIWLISFAEKYLEYWGFIWTVKTNTGGAIVP